MKPTFIKFCWLFFVIGFLVGCVAEGPVYEFKFHENGGSEVSDFEVQKRDWTGTLPVTTKEGYHFVGWFIDENLTIPATTESVSPGTVNLYAKWIPANVNVTVEHWQQGLDGVYVLFESEVIGGVIGEVSQANPKQYNGFHIHLDHPNHVLTGTPDGETPLHLSLYYYREQYTLRIEMEVTEEPMIQTYYYDEVIVLPALPNKPGYSFGGWYLDGIAYQVSYQPTKMPNVNLVITAKWNPNSVVITFVTNCDTVISPKTGFAHAELLITPMTKPGYTFGGWYLDSGFVNPWLPVSRFPVTSSTLYAKWIPSNVVVRVRHFIEKPQGGFQLDSELLYEGIVDTIFEAPPLSILGYELDGSHPNTVESGILRGDGGLVLTLYYRLVTYRVIFHENGGEDILDLEIKYQYPLPDPLVNPKRTGYWFNQWYLDEDLQTYQKIETMPARDLHFYASWRLATYHVTFQTNGSEPIDSLVGSILTPFTLPTPIYPDYEFQGWFREANFEIEYIDTGAFPLENLILYAKWMKKYSWIYFESNGAGVIEPLHQEINSSYSMPLPEREGYIFGGWFLDSSFTQQHVNTGTMAENDITLYAKWLGQTYRIHFDSMGGPYIQGRNVAAGDLIGVLPTPTRNGFEFLGWYDASLTNLFTETIMPANNINLYAKWRLLP